MTIQSIFFNQSFCKSFISKEPQCAALGMAEVDGNERGFIAIRTTHKIHYTNKFDLDVKVVGYIGFAMLHITLSFKNNEKYNMLINLNSEAKNVISTLEEAGECYVFNFHSNGVEVFNNQLDQNWYDFLGKKWIDNNLFNIASKANNSVEQFNKYASCYKDTEDVSGVFINMIYQDNDAFLDLQNDRIELKGYNFTDNSL